MPRAVWGGALTFGLVTLPVRLFTATDSHTVHFHQLERGTSDRVRNQRVNERTGEEVPLDAIVKGYDAGEEYVLVEPGELEDIAPGRSKALEIDGFVDLADIAPVYFDKTYYLGPKGKDFGKTYALLARAMEHRGKAAVATFVMRNREYLVAVKAEAGLLTLHTLHWADEIRDPEDIGTLPGKVEVAEREVRMAEQLIDALSKEWKPEEFHDTYQERVARLVEAKRTGEPVEKAEPPAESTNVVDLMDALRASVDRAKEKPRSSSGGSRPTTDIKKAARKRAAREKSAGLASLTKKELYEKAAEADIPGRSSMNRDDLVEALSKKRGGHRSSASSA